MKRRRRDQARPVIGVTVSRRSGWRIFPLIWLNLALAGGRALKWQRADQIDIAAVDGLIIGGGDDIFPGLYGTEIVTRVTLDPDRDRMEKALTEQALARDLPILGICRGAQMLNVVLGGTLHQDAFAVYPSRRYRTILPRRRISVRDDTRLAEIAGCLPMRINALHSQAVDRLGDGLRIAATDEAGMIQAIERLRDPFALGVQWHPEHIFYARRQRRLFRALVEAAAARQRGARQHVAVEELMRADKII
ncbi:gamma-glutamyl-gamma-aminobutyrate hydrolase family protein [Pseudooceanicola sp. CBS1P-1]|uniref:Gamma-glutamyl-gamma-aminobutyrate hydrolase family protein n=1 Tax=Pseudooceanicola albus TaxID=2692189 RepID=A0A6L7FZT6_9RHOB|nr:MULTISPECIES: gamma-glutamyl-gamma-aminobutyrate hydrolase family protein [Pseudooceanicola]MBT9382650.1 gamma-glutamyl-gamma-aminobutyrate hydrolase family protein [Pseudooceanicola endophyticus]MXN17189.1 gamma-glutamyl-gamma-aminobutyrate hydrolase family protein [Pseudooceanicola albus]